MAQAILLEDVESLGARGQAVDVAPGYLRTDVKDATGLDGGYDFTSIVADLAGFVDALGIGEKTRARAVYTDEMVMHDAIDETQRRFDVMLDEQHRSSAVCCQGTQDVAYDPSAFFIEIGFWFVEQEKSWLERDRSGDRQALLLAA